MSAQMVRHYSLKVRESNLATAGVRKFEAGSSEVVLMRAPKNGNGTWTGNGRRQIGNGSRRRVGPNAVVFQ